LGSPFFVFSWDEIAGVTQFTSMPAPMFASTEGFVGRVIGEEDGPFQ
jgi:hypothetical protein